MIIIVRGERGGPSMKITKKTEELKAGTVVSLPGGELLRIVEYIERYGGSGYNVYKVQFLQDDGDEYVPLGKERIMPAIDLVGGEYE